MEESSMGGSSNAQKKVGHTTKSARSKRVASQTTLNKKDATKPKASKSKTRANQGPTKEEYETLILEHRENGRKLSRSILRKWRVHMPVEEVDSIVDLALCESAKRFRTDKGASFMTFFFYHLRGHLVRAVAKATQACNLINGPKTDEWCDENHSEFASAYGAYLDNELSNQRENETPEQIMLRREKIEVCRTAVDKLDSLEKLVLTRSYSDDEALVDIAKSLGYSRCHISRVKKGALVRLKSVLSNSNGERTKGVLVPEVTLSKVKLEKKTRRKARSRKGELQANAEAA